MFRNRYRTEGRDMTGGYCAKMYGCGMNNVEANANSMETDMKMKFVNR